jgi:hypothetical protein
MAKLRSQARIIEALLSSLIIIGAVTISYTFYTPFSSYSISTEYGIPSNVIGFIVENGYLKYVFENPSVLISVCNEIIPQDFGFKITLYDENWNIIWSYQTADFTSQNEISAYLIINGFYEEFNWFLYFCCFHK